MNTLDIVLLVIVGMSALLGVYWGAIRQVLAIIGVVAGIAVAGRTYQQVADLLGAILPTAPDMLNVVAFVLVFTVVSLIVSLVATLLRFFVGLLFLGWLDHLIGGVLGVLQGLLVVTMLLVVLTAFPAAGLSSAVASSRLGSWLSAPVRWTLPLFPDRFKLPNELMFGAKLLPEQLVASTRRPFGE